MFTFFCADCKFRKDPPSQSNHAALHAICFQLTYVVSALSRALSLSLPVKGSVPPPRQQNTLTVYLLLDMVDVSRRFIPSSYRPSFASLVQVAWQAYMSRVSYDNPSPTKATTQAANSGGVSVRGGGGEMGVGVAVGVAAKENGVRHLGGDGIVPSQGFPMAVTAIDGGTARRTPMVDRRSTGRYAYTSSSSGAGVGRDGAGSSSGELKDDSSVRGGGGGSGVRVVGVARTSSTSSSPLLSKAKEL